MQTSSSFTLLVPGYHGLPARDAELGRRDQVDLWLGRFLNGPAKRDSRVLHRVPAAVKALAMPVATDHIRFSESTGIWPFLQ